MSSIVREVRSFVFSIANIWKKVTRIPVVLVRNGFLHSFRLLYIILVLPVIMKVLPVYLRVFLKVKRTIKRSYFTDKEMQYWRDNYEELLAFGKKGYRIKVEILGLTRSGLERVKKSQQSHEVVIAEIDQDGFLLSHFGPIQNAPTVSKEHFLARKRNELKLVVFNGYVGVKKNYNGQKRPFLNELKTLHNLSVSESHVPAIMKVDFDNLTLTVSYILGSVLREELAKNGALLRDRDVDNNPEFVRLDLNKKWLKRIQEGRRVLYNTVDSHFVGELLAELDKIHASGFVFTDIKYGNIIIERDTGKPYLIDFEGAHQPSLGKNPCRILRDRGIEMFNLHFGTNKLTYNRIKERIKLEKVQGNEIYAPVYFGAGLRMGRIWDVESGYGRWNYILKHNLPSLSEKRILDLGANNAFNSIQMLRHGAREVIGIELSEQLISQGNFVKAAFEWADNKRYNFRYIHADMKDVPKMNLGKFDIVLALCSIYYLDDEAIDALAQYISTMTDTFILQCNIATNPRSNPLTHKRASVDYALRLLKKNGFSNIKLIAPYKYNRPLLIGRK